MDSLRIKIEKKLRTFLCILVPFLLLIFIGCWTYNREFAVLYPFSVLENLRYKYLSFIG